MVFNRKTVFHNQFTGDRAVLDINKRFIGKTGVCNDIYLNIEYAGTCVCIGGKTVGCRIA